MAHYLSNDALKIRNEKIFKVIEKKLALDDEKAYIEAAEKITKFIERREAYYAEARPSIVNVFKTARQTLTRLSHSPIPFQCKQPYSSSLESRVVAYRALIATGFLHSSTFADDNLIKEELNDIFASARPEISMELLPQPNGQPSVLQHGMAQALSNPTLSTNEKQKGLPLPPLSTALGRVEQAPVATPVHSPSVTPIPQITPDSSSPITSPIQPKTKLPTAQIASPLTALRYATPNSASPAPASPPGMNQQKAATRLAASVVTPRSTTSLSPIIVSPTFPSAHPADTAGASSSSKLSGNTASAKPILKLRKKPKLGKSSLINSSLVQEDVNWYASKQRIGPEPYPQPTPSAAGNTTIEENTPVAVKVSAAVKEEHGSPALSFSMTAPGSNIMSGVSGVQNSSLSTEPSSSVPTDRLKNKLSTEPAIIDLTSDNEIDIVVAPSLPPSGQENIIDLTIDDIDQSLPLVSARKGKTKGSPEVFSSESNKQPMRDAAFELPEVDDDSGGRIADVVLSPSSVSPKSTQSLPSQIAPIVSNSSVPMDMSSDTDVENIVQSYFPLQSNPRFPAEVPALDKNYNTDYNQEIPNQHEADTKKFGRSETAVVGQPGKSEESAQNMMDVDNSETEPALSMDLAPQEHLLSGNQGQSIKQAMQVDNCNELEILGQIPPMKSVFSPSAAVYVSVNLGGIAGESVVMDFELSSDQEALLTRWRTREQHKQDASNSICLSLACYKQDDIVEAGLEINKEDDDMDMSGLAKLTPSWPMNSRLSADIGTSRLFLAPPIQTTGEKFVDVTSFVNEKHIQIKLEHACDMTSYVFALIAHPPTSSQLQTLEERMAKNSKWEVFLDGLARPFTLGEVFG